MNPDHHGTKCCALYPLTLGPGEERVVQMRLAREGSPTLTRAVAAHVFAERIREADEFYADYAPGLTPEALRSSGRPSRDCSGASSITTS